MSSVSTKLSKQTVPSEIVQFSPNQLTSALAFHPTVTSLSASHVLFASVTSPVKKVSRLGSWIFEKVFPASWSFAKLSNDLITSGYMPDIIIRAALK